MNKKSIKDVVANVKDRTFSDENASEMFSSIPGPTFDGLPFSNLLGQLQAYLVDQGHEDDAEQLE
jgi:hypothetical protein